MDRWCVHESCSKPYQLKQMKYIVSCVNGIKIGQGVTEIEMKQGFLCKVLLPVSMSMSHIPNLIMGKVLPPVSMSMSHTQPMGITRSTVLSYVHEQM